MFVLCTYLFKIIIKLTVPISRKFLSTFSRWSFSAYSAITMPMIRMSRSGPNGSGSRRGHIFLATATTRDQSGKAKARCGDLSF